MKVNKTTSILIAVILITSIFAYKFMDNQNQKLLLQKSMRDALETKLYHIKSELDYINDRYAQQILINSLKLKNYLEESNSFISNNGKMKIKIMDENRDKTDITIDKWSFKGQTVYNNKELIKEVKKDNRSFYTIFQKTKFGFLRIATNIVDENNRNGVGTFIGKEHKIAKLIDKDEVYYGKRLILGKIYSSAYMPLKDKFNKIIGMVYSGILDKSYIELQEEFKKLYKTNATLMIIDRDQNIILAPEFNAPNLKKALKDVFLYKKGMLNLNDGYCYIYNTYEKYDWKIIGIISQESLILKTTNPVKFAIIVFFLILFIIMIIMFIYKVKRLCDPFDEFITRF